MDIYIELVNGTNRGLKNVTTVTSIDRYPTITVPLTGASTTLNELTVTVASTTGLLPGMDVYGNGACSGQKVAGIVSATVFMMTHGADATSASGSMVATGVSVADMEIMRVDDYFYRDTFTAQTDLAASVGGTTLTEQWKTPGIVSLPSSAEITSTGALAGKLGVPSISISDEIRHFPLRQTSYLESQWAFTVVNAGETLIHYWRKAQVVGWGNVQPDD